MDILIVAATPQEISPLLKAISFEKENTTGVREGFYKGLHTDVLLTGPGIAACALHLGKTLTSRTPYHLCINAGIAGCFEKKIKTIFHQHRR